MQSSVSKSELQNKTAVTAATARRFGARTGTHKFTNKSISSEIRKINKNFLHPFPVREKATTTQEV